jgi:hypothetical protein
MRQGTNARRRPAASLASLALIAVVAVAAGRAAAQGQSPEAVGFKKHFVVEISNPSPLALENHALVIDVADIRASVAADFNTYYYAFFEERGGEYALVVSQADDLDKDRYHDEIVLVRTLPPSSTTRLLCYYTPNQSFRLMPTEKAFARAAWKAGDAEAGWESNLAAYKFVHGRIGYYGKLQPGLVLRKFPAAETRSQDWGMDVLGGGESAGLGGLSLWDGGARIALFGAAAPQAKLTVVTPGPVRALVKAEYPAVGTGGGEVGLTVFFSAFADCPFSRQDVVISSKASGPLVIGPGIDRLDGETWSMDKDKGFLAVWGNGVARAGEIGLAVIFPPAVFSGMDETSADRALKLNARAGRKLTYWVSGAWDRGVTTPGVPAAKNWARKTEELAARLLVPVRIEFKAK